MTKQEALAEARAASHRVSEARIEIARLGRLVAEQDKIINRDLSKIDAYLAVSEALA